MTTFTATKQVSFTSGGMSAFDILTSLSSSVLVDDAGQFKLDSSAHSTELTLLSADDSFLYGLGHGLPPTGGTVSSVQVNTYTGGGFSIAYKFTGLSLSVTTLENDVLTGGGIAVLNDVFGGNDVIRGSRFNDYLAGFGGDDRVIGGAGNDRMAGGPGNDAFVFQAGFGHDVVTDFSAGPAVGDVIEMHGMFHTLAQVRSHSHLQANLHNLVIVVDASDSITLSHVRSKAALSANDFHFF